MKLKKFSYKSFIKFPDNVSKFGYIKNFQIYKNCGFQILQLFKKFNKIFKKMKFSFKNMKNYWKI